MDLRPITVPATPDEIAAVDAVLGADTSTPGSTVPFAEALRRRPMLLPVLHAVQSRCGWISQSALGYAARRLHVPPAEAWGVASFYALFALEQRPEAMVHVCDDIACTPRGAEALCDALTQRLGPAGSQTTGVGWARSPCLGQCDRAPAALLQIAGAKPVEGVITRATVHSVMDALGRRRAPAPVDATIWQAPEELRLLRRVRITSPA